MNKIVGKILKIFVLKKLMIWIMYNCLCEIIILELSGKNIVKKLGFFLCRRLEDCFDGKLWYYCVIWVIDFGL